MRPHYWRKPIGEILIEKGLATRLQLEQGLALQQHKPGQKIGAILVGLGYVTTKDLLRAYADQLGTAYAKAWVGWRES
ncbi:MAG: hypothetical protein GTO55_02680 [Armatimonadetes bacterium]|nr:hypothetical protein [Armatimonadota bacterium]NIM23185.1 hypothetical protein [Armatimonadota bacterium]NIM67053.1 hypothetical protein [Armatimonadota bacterium]NIM75587.1 hypothetical protein [Armatimonadota bacterium]NIN05242.1 hypothetical protein [Armatimonadota bacterium]